MKKGPAGFCVSSFALSSRPAMRTNRLFIKILSCMRCLLESGALSHLSSQWLLSLAPVGYVAM